jgi:hypothetical protein
MIVEVAGLKVSDFATAGDFLRAIYNQGYQSILDQAQRMVSRGKSLEEAAKHVVNARNQLKRAVRAQGPKLFERLNEARNLRKYGNPLGPNYSQIRQALIAKGVPVESVDQAIINGITKTSAALH